MAEENTLSEWTEVNITPTSSEQREKLLLDLVEPLIHEVLGGRVGDWHYFWEPALRLRIRWMEPTRADLEKLTSALKTAKSNGEITDWYYGSHGVPGQVYPGEAEKFGAEIWPYTYRHWTTGCELALSLVKRDPDNVLTELSQEHPDDNMSREFHWIHAVHLFSNPMGLDHLNEGRWCLRQGRNQVIIAHMAAEQHSRDQEVVDVLQVIVPVVNLLDNTLQRLHNEATELPDASQ